MCRVNVTATLFTNPFESQILMKFNLKRHKTHIRPNRVQPNESLSCVEQPLASIVGGQNTTEVNGYQQVFK